MRACATLLLAAGLTSIVRVQGAAGDVRVSGKRRELLFACELDTDPLGALFSQPGVISGLKELNAGVSLALIDLSPGRARVVRQLDEAGIPVIAWLALPRDQGYYLNADNAAQGAARFGQFEKWTAAFGLRWAGVGLDIEPGLQDFAALQQGDRRGLAWKLVRRYFDTGRVTRAREAYTALIRRIQSRGYRVQTYQLPFIVNERKAHSTLLERLLGIVDVRGDDEVLMLYSSFNHAAGAALIWKFGPDVQTIVVGSTAGDPQAGASFTPLNWDELSRDLIVASHFAREVGVYSLEGCVRQGFLPRLKTMDWSRSVVIPQEALAKVSRIRTLVQAGLWIGSLLPVFLAAFLAAAILVFRRLRRKRSSQ